jgi:hypothetical protein
MASPFHGWPNSMDSIRRLSHLEYLPLKNLGVGIGDIVCLPFGMVLRHDTHRNEAKPMEYVRNHVSIPISKSFRGYV